VNYVTNASKFSIAKLMHPRLTTERILDVALQLFFVVSFAPCFEVALYEMDQLMISVPRDAMKNKPPRRSNRDILES
jgi:hypothetical protein